MDELKLVKGRALVDEINAIKKLVETDCWTLNTTDIYDIYKVPKEIFNKHTVEIKVWATYRLKELKREFENL